MHSIRKETINGLQFRSLELNKLCLMFMLTYCEATVALPLSTPVILSFFSFFCALIKLNYFQKIKLEIQTSRKPQT